MKREKLQTQYASMPEIVKQRLSHTLDHLEEEKPMKKKVGASILTAVLILAALAGAAYAAARMGVLDFIGYTNPWEPLEGAQEMVMENVSRVNAPQSNVTISVREALFDGASAHLVYEFRGGDNDFLEFSGEMAEDKDDLTIGGATKTYQEWREQAERSWYAGSMRIAQQDASSDNSYMEVHEAPNVLIVYHDCSRVNAPDGKVEVALRVSDYRTGERSELNMALDLNAPSEGKILMYPDTIRGERFAIRNVKLSFTPVASYVDLEIQTDRKDGAEYRWNLISGSGHIWQMVGGEYTEDQDGFHRVTFTAQPFEQLPESLTIQWTDFDDPSQILDTITLAFDH